MESKNTIVYVSVCAAIVGISYGMHTPIVPVFAKDVLNADYSQIGLIGMVNYLPYMFAPLAVGMVLDRANKSYLLSAGIGLNVFSIFMLSQAQSIPEVMVFRFLSGVSHALFWPSSEAIIATNSNENTRVKGIAIFTACWVGGFTVGPLIGRIVLASCNDYSLLFELSSVAIALAMVPSILLHSYAKPSAKIVLTENIEKKKTVLIASVAKEFARYPSVSSVLVYYAVTFGVILSIFPAYMRDYSITDQEIESLFFIFGIARFATLFTVQKISAHGVYALALGVFLASVAMLITFSSASVLSFAVSLVLIGFATSIFYPVTLNIVTKGIPKEMMGSRLGVYETIFGMGWAAGPIIVGTSADVFGAASPYLSFFMIGMALSIVLVLVQRRRLATK